MMQDHSASPEPMGAGVTGVTGSASGSTDGRARTYGPPVVSDERSAAHGINET